MIDAALAFMQWQLNRSAGMALFYGFEIPLSTPYRGFLTLTPPHA
jgi:hypothetical protein